MKTRKNILKPRNFSRLPPSYRPKRTFRASRSFVKQVKEVQRLGKRADTEDIGDVIAIMNNMKVYRPKLFTRKNKKNKKYNK